MHTAPLGERVSEVAVWAGDAVLGQVLLQPGRLVVGVVLLLPPGEVLAADPLVLRLPGHQALGAAHGAAVGAHKLLVLGVREETKGTLIQRWCLDSKSGCRMSLTL